MDSFSTASTYLGFDLLNKPRKRTDGNILFSPVGISTTIGMILMGSRGITASQLQEVFCSEEDTESSGIKAEEEIEKTEEINHLFQKFLTGISKLTDDYGLNITNRLFAEKTYLFLQKYLDYVEKYYHASLEPVDFMNAADESRNKINSWVESQTQESTKDLFPDGSLSSLTKLVLMNTIYFKGQWDRKFKKENTKEEAFWLNKSTSRSVLMMTLKHSFSFTFLEDLQAKIVGIPYKNNDLSLFVLLPNDIDGLEEIIDKISPEQLVEWTSPGHMEKRSVHLHVPRLEVEDSYFLEDVLADMAMGNNFGECQANCLEMSPRSSLQAQKILHRCCIALTEEGTEAAAATGIDFNDASAPGDENPRDENVCCDHPFLFFIRHNESKNVLFFGRFSSP
ncbi:serpin B13 isoform X1 [Otolemur garnettii]|uniref:serpin B13 isoform X1 n=1 Tax=Otolemur garnettii TaxID=30611 RepID=UPI00064445BA|nr:serpin B13 isoform X1 [Otolemur garnettii]